MDMLRANLLPRCTELAKLHGLTLTDAEGRQLLLELIPERCKDAYPADRVTLGFVTLGFVLGEHKYAVWMKPRPYWNTEEVAHSMENALINGSLINSESEPFPLDLYKESD